MRQDTLATSNGFSPRISGRGGGALIAAQLCSNATGRVNLPCSFGMASSGRRKLRHRRALSWSCGRRASVRGLFGRADSLSFGEAFVYNQVDINGSLLDIFAPADRLINHPLVLS